MNVLNTQINRNAWLRARENLLEKKDISLQAFVERFAAQRLFSKGIKQPNGQRQMDLILDEFLDGSRDSITHPEMGPLVPLSPVDRPLTPIVSDIPKITTLNNFITVRHTFLVHATCYKNREETASPKPGDICI